jgi:hypothetical protein
VDERFAYGLGVMSSLGSIASALWQLNRLGHSHPHREISMCLRENEREEPGSPGGNKCIFPLFVMTSVSLVSSAYA